MIRKYIFGIVLGSLTVGCHDEQTPFCEKFEPGKIMVGTDPELNLEQSFDLINNYDLYIDRTTGAYYESSLPSDSIDYVISYLNAKDYINKEGFSAVKGGSVSLHYQTGLIMVSCTLWDMTETNQQDWNETKTILALTEKSYGKYFILTVPVGQEKKWVKTFKGQPDVQYAELSCFIELNPWP